MSKGETPNVPTSIPEGTAREIAKMRQGIYNLQSILINQGIIPAMRQNGGKIDMNNEAFKDAIKVYLDSSDLKAFTMVAAQKDVIEHIDSLIAKGADPAHFEEFQKEVGSMEFIIEKGKDNKGNIVDKIVGVKEGSIKQGTIEQNLREKLETEAGINELVSQTLMEQTFKNGNPFFNIRDGEGRSTPITAMDKSIIFDPVKPYINFPKNNSWIFAGDQKFVQDNISPILQKRLTEFFAVEEDVYTLDKQKLDNPDLQKRFGEALSSDLAAAEIAHSAINKLVEDGLIVAPEKRQEIVETLTYSLATFGSEYLEQNRKELIEDLTTKLYEERSVILSNVVESVRIVTSGVLRFVGAGDWFTTPVNNTFYLGPDRLEYIAEYFEDKAAAYMESNPATASEVQPTVATEEKRQLPANLLAELKTTLAVRNAAKPETTASTLPEVASSKPPMESVEQSLASQQPVTITTGERKPPPPPAKKPVTIHVGENTAESNTGRLPPSPPPKPSKEQLPSTVAIHVVQEDTTKSKAKRLPPPPPPKRGQTTNQPTARHR